MKYDKGIELIFATSSQNKFINNERIKKRVAILKSIRNSNLILDDLIHQKDIHGLFLYGRSYLTFNGILRKSKKHNIPTILDVVELPTLNIGFHEYIIHPFTLDSYLSFKSSSRHVSALSFITTSLQNLYGHVNCEKYLLPSIESWKLEKVHQQLDNNVFVFSYVGALLEKDAPNRLYELLKLLCLEQIEFQIKIIGRYEKFSEGRSWKQKFKDVAAFQKHIIWVGEVTDDELAIHLEKSNGLILLRQNRKLEEYSFPTRLVEYLKTSRPVFITDKGDIPIYLEHMKTACFIHPSDMSKSLSDIIKIMSNPSIGEKIGIGGFRIGSELFNRKFHSEKIIKLFQKLK
ncbi:MAG: glycosyltransferase [Saprospiraceae bacterium]|nr:glycosyltransferase [Saprospiraceae bacterium]